MSPSLTNPSTKEEYQYPSLPSPSLTNSRHALNQSCHPPWHHRNRLQLALESLRNHKHRYIHVHVYKWSPSDHWSKPHTLPLHIVLISVWEGSLCRLLSTVCIPYCSLLFRSSCHHHLQPLPLNKAQLRYPPNPLRHYPDITSCSLDRSLKCLHLSLMILYYSNSPSQVHNIIWYHFLSYSSPIVSHSNDYLSYRYKRLLSLLFLHSILLWLLLSYCCKVLSTLCNKLVMLCDLF